MTIFTRRKIKVVFLSYPLIGIMILKSFSTSAQTINLTLIKICNSQIPDNIKLPPNVANSYKWKDALGDNYLILTNQKKDTSIENRIFGSKWKTGYIEAYHFLANGSNKRLVKYIKDNIVPCDGSYVNEFIENSIMITDLNKDDIGEITFQYKYACRSDPTPAEKTLIYMENGIISRLNGYMMNTMINGKIRKDMNFEIHKKSNPELDLHIGYYMDEKDFDSKSNSVKTHVRNQWNKHIYESNF